jgi:heat shock protein HslJ/uncharacterized lipoprotein NlpE involved in copper resistance
MRYTIITLAAAVCLSACVPRNHDAAASGTPSAAPPVDMHNSRNSLDWAGAYEGVLPCADCPGIKTRLTLGRDGRYELSTQYLDRQPAPQVARGQFTWNAAGSAVQLDAAGGGQQFAVGEGRLTLLNRDGTPLAPSATNRVLTLVAPPAAGASGPAATVKTLESHRWTLESATDAQGRRIDAVSPVPGRAFELGFAGARIHVKGGCNRMNGGYEIGADGQLKVGRLAATMMACESAAMQADTALSALLAKPLKVDLAPGGSAPVLRLVAAEGQVLVLKGQATPEALYGPATRIFLEVAAQRVACTNPLDAAASTCLQVRDRVFDAQGLVVLPHGPWRPFYDSIEGYTHQPGVRNVLRINRYQRAAAPAGTSAAVYVLDLVVESETVAR